MDTLFIDRKHITLGVDGSRLTVQYPDTSRNSLPLASIGTIVAGPDLQLDTAVLRTLNRHGVNLVVTDGKNAEAITVTTPYRHGHAGRRLRQYQLLSSPAVRLAFSRRLMRLKLYGQARRIRQWQALRPDLRYPLTKSLKGLMQSRAEIAGAGSLQRLRGLEGQAAACYFEALALTFPPHLGFRGRNKRPPRDPVNVALSLTYTLLQHEALNALNAAGLDPMLGYFHELDYGRESLACDLIEPLRVEADRFVHELFASTLLNAGHFSSDAGGACRMDKTGRANFYHRYFEQARIWRGQLRKLALMHARLLERYTVGSGV